MTRDSSQLQDLEMGSAGKGGGVSEGVNQKVLPVGDVGFSDNVDINCFCILYSKLHPIGISIMLNDIIVIDD